MSSEKINVKIILGSIREGRFGEHPARWIFDLAKTREEIAAELLDLRDHPLPLFADPVSPSDRTGESPHEAVKKWSQKIKEADAYIIVSPEYNHGYPGTLKNAFDHLFHEWGRKPVGFISYGGVGGARSVEQLRLVSIELNMVPLRTALHIQTPWTLLNEDGSLKDGALKPFEGKANKLLDDLIWFAEALKAAKAV